jgi:pilus assembly protein FimV
MRTTVMNKLVVLAALAAFVPTAGAVGIGNANALSSLGQNLHVEIEILSASPQERGTLSAKLGSPRTYEQSNVQLGVAGSSGIRVSVERRSNGAPYIRVISSKPVVEPFVNLVIELTSVSGPVTREFAVLLDPPEYTPPKSVEAAAQPLAARPEVKNTVLPPPTQAQTTESDYGPIRPGETLSRIAAQVRPQNATLQQTMLGIFRHNPTAFINQNMNLLKAGHRLRIPPPDQITALPQEDSAQTLKAQTSAWATSRNTAPTESSTPKPQAPLPAPPAGKAPAPAKAREAGKPVIKLSSGASAGKNSSIEQRVRMLEEDLSARERALNDANERIKRLEKAAEGRAVGSPAGERQK